MRAEEKRKKEGGCCEMRIGSGRLHDLYNNSFMTGEIATGTRPAAAIVVKLESELSAYLDETRNRLVRRLSEVAIGLINDNGVEVGAIEEIEEFKAKLESYRLRDGCVL
jgi:hypothetical protein